MVGSHFNILNMNTLEIKGSLFDLLWGIEDEETLLKIRNVIYELVTDSLKSKGDWWDELSAEQQERLDRALADARNGKNVIPHEQVVKKFDEKLKSFSK